MERKLAGILMTTLLLLWSASPVMASCSWTNREVLSDTTSGQPGLTVFGGKLYLSFAMSSNQELKIESATDGFTFQNQVILSAFRSNLGVGLGTSAGTPNACGQIFLGFVGTDSNSTLNMAYSSDGVNWSGAYQSYTNVTATPQFAATEQTVHFSFSQWYNGNPTAAKASFNCPGISGVGGETYWVYTGCPSYYLTCGGNSTGSVGLVDQFLMIGNQEAGPFTLVSVAQPGSKSSLPITYQVDGSSILDLGGNWSNSGDTATLAPNPSSPYHPNFYIAWRGGGGYLNIAHVDYYGNFLAQQTCSDWSPSSPSIAYFNGSLFVAWRGGNNQIGIASLNPF